MTNSVVKQVSVDVEKHAEKLSTINKPLIDSVNELKEEIKVLSGNTHKSVMKGKIGESSLIFALQNYFPISLVEDMSKVNNQSDIRFSCVSLGLNNIWIEVKTYNKAVPTVEIEKFKNEMTMNNVEYGIFASTTSRIAKHNTLDIETLSYGGKIIYIPNAGLEGLMVVYGLLYISEIKMKESGKNKLSETNEIHKDSTSDKIIVIIKQEIERMSLHLKCYYNLRKSLEKTFKDLEKILKKQMNELDENLSDIEQQFNSSVQKIIGILSLY